MENNASGKKGVLMGLTLACLRIEGAEEYRLCDGEVEVRQHHAAIAGKKRNWRRVTSAELRNHVNRNTVVAQWLTHRLGWRPLLWACLADQDLSCLPLAVPRAQRDAA